MTSRRLLDAPAKLLLDAADYIEEHGWCQNINIDADRRVCAMGALTTVSATMSQDDFNVATDRLSKIVGQFQITLWNDEPSRTQEEVVAALRQAAISA